MNECTEQQREDGTKGPLRYRSQIKLVAVRDSGNIDLPGARGVGDKNLEGARHGPRTDSR